jgi:hypothetical protein
MNSSKKNNLDDLKVNVKIKLSALWTSVTLCYLYGDYFELYVPKKVEGLLGGNNLLDSPTKLFFAAVLLAIPALMVFLSILLKASINRWLNIFVGLFFTIIMLFITSVSISPWKTFYAFLAILESIITSLIVYYAWSWSKQNQISENYDTQLFIKNNS